MGYTHHRFPVLHKTPKNVAKQRTSPWQSHQSPASNGPKPFPYIALTQTCMQIRAEFRPMWLPTHRIPFNLTDSYFKAFFPTRIRKALVRFKPHADTIVGFRVWVRKGDLGTRWDGCDVTRLLRHKARFPDCTIMCRGLLAVYEKLLRASDSFLNHSNLTWLMWIRTGRISQVRLGLDPEEDDQVSWVIVVKEKFAEPWMKALSTAPPKGAWEGAMERFGFESKFEKARFSVDYS